MDERERFETLYELTVEIRNLLREIRDLLKFNGPMPPDDFVYLRYASTTTTMGLRGFTRRWC